MHFQLKLLKRSNGATVSHFLSISLHIHTPHRTESRTLNTWMKVFLFWFCFCFQLAHESNYYIKDMMAHLYVLTFSSIFFLLCFFAGHAEQSVGVGDHCAGCNQPILEKFLLNVCERRWHTRCVRCTECNHALVDKCFSRDGKLFCKTDFFR